MALFSTRLGLLHCLKYRHNPATTTYLRRHKMADSATSATNLLKDEATGEMISKKSNPQSLVFLN